MDNGEIVTEGTVDELKREVAGDVVTVGVNGSASFAAELLNNQDYVRSLEQKNGELRLYVDEGAVAIPHILRLLDHAGVALNQMELHRPSLDDVFLTKTGRSLRES